MGIIDMITRRRERLYEGIEIDDDVTIRNVHSVVIGKNVTIKTGTLIDGGEKSRYHENGVLIEKGSWIGEGCYIHGAGRVEINENVGIGPHVKILTSQHKGMPWKKPVMNTELEFDKVVIECGADIGMGAIILPGVAVGSGAIIGAGAVVTRHVPSMAIVAGNPAKLIRYRTEKE